MLKQMTRLIATSNHCVQVSTKVLTAGSSIRGIADQILALVFIPTTHASFMPARRIRSPKKATANTTNRDRGEEPVPLDRVRSRLPELVGDDPERGAQRIPPAAFQAETATRACG